MSLCMQVLSIFRDNARGHPHSHSVQIHNHSSHCRIRDRPQQSSGTALPPASNSLPTCLVACPSLRQKEPGHSNSPNPIPQSLFHSIWKISNASQPCPRPLCSGGRAGAKEILKLARHLSQNGRAQRHYMHRWEGPPITH